ncbi:MAG: hypothetical protein QOK05_2501 [Chloroflexota bacterium]|jgi:hypothetical protein|nr:hypothetical protein [Chloroflexota bacterium]
MANRAAAATPQPKNGPARLWAFSVGSYLLLLVILAGNAIVINHGHFEYVLDDAYIHLSMARNLVTTGTYGVVPGTYESASSSPLWTMLLAVSAGMWPLTFSALPALLNMACAIALLWLFWEGQDLVKPAARIPVAGVALAALLPLFLLLPSLTLAGMEAILQALLALGVMQLLLRLLRGREGTRPELLLLLLVAVSVLVRLEDMFLAAGCGLAVLVFGRGRLQPIALRVTLTAKMGLAAALPAAAIAAVNLANGQAWLPNSVVSKAGLFERRGLPLVPFDVVIERLMGDPLLVALLVVSALYLGRCALLRVGTTNLPLALAFLVTAVLHLALATLGWYDRYQEYLVVIGAWLLFRYAAEVAPERRMAAAMLAVLALLLVSSPRKAILTIFTPTASNNIYLQQYQMGQFLARYYNDTGAVINDLGEVSYQHHGPIFDMFGLGSYQALKARRDGRFDAGFVAAQTRRINAPVAVIYSEYWRQQIPASWVLVGSWSVLHAPGNLGGTKVDFWATSAATADELRRDLREYGRELPDGVRAEVR